MDKGFADIDQEFADIAIQVLRRVANDIENRVIDLREFAYQIGDHLALAASYRSTVAPPRGGRPCACGSKPLETTDSDSQAHEYQCLDCGAEWLEPFEE